MRTSRLTIPICAAGILFCWLLMGPVALERTIHGRNDFVAFYGSGRLAFSPDLYNVDAFMKAEASFTGFGGENLIFVRFPWQAVLFAPLGVFSYANAHIVWLLLCAASLVMFVRCWPAVPQPARAGVVAWSIPLAMSIAGGQDTALLLLALGGGFWLLERNQPLAAGLCLSLCAAKPHLFWPLALVFPARRMWSVCAGGAIGTAALTAISFFAAGPRWVGGFLDALAYIERLDNQWKLKLMPTFPALLSGMPSEPIVEGCAVVATIAAVLLIRNWKAAAAVAIIMGTLTAKHAFLADCSFLLAPLLLTWNEPRHREALFLATSPVAMLPAYFGHAGWTMAALLCAAAWLSLPVPQPTGGPGDAEPIVANCPPGHP